MNLNLTITHKLGEDERRLMRLFIEHVLKQPGLSEPMGAEGPEGSTIHEINDAETAKKEREQRQREGRDPY